MQLHERISRLVKAYNIARGQCPLCQAHEPVQMRFVSLEDVSLKVVYRCPKCGRKAAFIIDEAMGTLTPISKECR